MNTTYYLANRDSAIPLLMVDNGDGTYSLATSAASGGGSGSIPGLASVNTLGTPGVARAQATSAATASIVLTSTCRRLSMYASAGTWYSISGPATASSHYIAAGERLDFSVPENTTISVLQETAAGVVRITELV